MYIKDLIISAFNYISDCWTYRSPHRMIGLEPISPSEPRTNLNSTSTDELLLKFPFTVKLVVNFKCNFAHGFRKTQTIEPGLESRHSA